MSRPITVALVRAESGPSEVHLTLDGARITHRWGQVGGPTRQRVETFDSPQRAQVQLENRVFRLVSKGYRIGVEHPEIIEAIAESPSDPSGYQVYCDWLDRHADPRAELIRRTQTMRRCAELEAWLQTHRWQFLRRDWQIFALTWWMGFIHTVRYPLWMRWLHPSRDAAPDGDRLRVTNRWARTFLLQLRRHPSGRFVQFVEEPTRNTGRGEPVDRWRVSFDFSIEPWGVFIEPATGGVPLNFADIATLMRLPGVGDRLARRIVRHRERHGDFESVEQLIDVTGVGSALVERLRSQVFI